MDGGGGKEKRAKEGKEGEEERKGGRMMSHQR
jgi:hypothetical protein